MHWYARGLSCKPNIYVSWSTSELRVRLAPWNRFKPSSKIFLLIVPRRYFFCGPFVLFKSCVSHAFAPVHCCLAVTCWEMADLPALVGDVYCMFCYFTMWYPGSGAVFDCIVTWSLTSFLLLLTTVLMILDQTCTVHKVLLQITSMWYKIIYFYRKNRGPRILKSNNRHWMTRRWIYSNSFMQNVSRADMRKTFESLLS